MCDARIESEWSRCASMLAMIHNVNCAKKKDMMQPIEFMPNYKPPRADITALKALLPGGS